MSVARSQPCPSHRTASVTLQARSRRVLVSTSWLPLDDARLCRSLSCGRIHSGFRYKSSLCSCPSPPLSLAPPPSPSTNMPKAAYATSAFYQKHGAKGPANMSNTSSCHGSIKPCDRPLPARGKEKARSRNKKEKTQREVRTSCPQYTPIR